MSRGNAETSLPKEKGEYTYFGPGFREAVGDDPEVRREIGEIDRLINSYLQQHNVDDPDDLPEVVIAELEQRVSAKERLK